MELAIQAAAGGWFWIYIDLSALVVWLNAGGETRLASKLVSSSAASEEALLPLIGAGL